MAQAEAFAAKFGLAKDKTWRSWEQGPSKLFLNDLEHQFDAEMIQQLRKMGVKVPIVTTSCWGGDSLSSLPALISGDMIDVHSYGGVDELEKNPLYAPTFIDWMAAAHVIDRPLSVTEWNVSPFPTPDRDTTPLFVASSASFQGWDALMQFAYSRSRSMVREARQIGRRLTIPRSLPPYQRPHYSTGAVTFKRPRLHTFLPLPRTNFSINSSRRKPPLPCVQPLRRQVGRRYAADPRAPVA